MLSSSMDWTERGLTGADVQSGHRETLSRVRALVKKLTCRTSHRWELVFPPN